MEERIRRVLRLQHGAISYGQLIAVGLTWAAIRARVSRGVLVPLFYRAYVAGDPLLIPLAREAAALLSVGRAAVLSHRSAAVVWDIVSPDARRVHITALGSPRQRPGIELHRVTELHPADVRTRSNLRLTSPARTLIDLAAQASSAELEGAFGEARAKRLVTDAALQTTLARAPKNHPGAAIVRRRLSGNPGSTYTRSGAERLVRRLMKSAELPQPLVNHSVNGFTVDFLWPAERLIIEVDGYDTHGDRLAFEHDRKRDQMHVAAGYTVIRVTWRQLTEEPYAVLARIAQALCRPAART